MKKFTILSTSAALVATVILSGCSGSSTATGDVSISGKAIDPYLSGSTVCLDLNTNGKCDANEPQTITNDVGDYTLEVAQEHHDAAHSLLVTGGTDIGTGTPFTGTLTAVKELEQRAQNITPLTTAVEARYQYCQTHDKCDANVAEIKANLAEYLNLSTEDIYGDIVALANSGDKEPLTTALAIQNAAVLHNANDAYAAYQEVAQYGFPAGHNWQDDLRTLMPKSHGLVTAIMSIDEGVLENAAIDTLNAGVQAGTDTANAGVEAGEDAANAGEEAHSTAHQIAQYVYGLTHQTTIDTAHETAEDAHDAAHETATETADTAVETETEAHDTAHETAEDAYDAADETATETSDTAVETATDAYDTAAEEVSPLDL